MGAPVDPSTEPTSAGLKPLCDTNTTCARQATLAPRGTQAQHKGGWSEGKINKPMACENATFIMAQFGQAQLGQRTELKYLN